MSILKADISALRLGTKIDKLLYKTLEANAQENFGVFATMYQVSNLIRCDEKVLLKNLSAPDVETVKQKLNEFGLHLDV